MRTDSTESIASKDREERVAFHNNNSSNDARNDDDDVPKRSIARFAPTHQSIFDESDEEFLPEIRRPRSPIAFGLRRTFASIGSEQMDVERTIAAAFGGRPSGGGALAAPVYYQPVQVAPAPALTPSPAPTPTPTPVATSRRSASSQARQELIQTYSQQRRQFVRESGPAPEGPVPTADVAPHSLNYHAVARDRTPRIIRRIAFDEEMMALARTPEPSAYTVMAMREQKTGDDTPAGEKRKRSVIFSPEDEAQDFSRRRTRL